MSYLRARLSPNANRASMKKSLRASSKYIPRALRDMQKIINNADYKLSTEHTDGRVNSSIDEKNILNLVEKKMPGKIRIAKDRWWYDFLIKEKNKWLPVNIKCTYMKSADAAGNLAICTYALTNHKMSLKKRYQNSKLAPILTKKLLNREYNKSTRDYYFLVIDKATKLSFVNSILGLSVLSPGNIPFHIDWKKNLRYKKKPIEASVKLFVNCRRQNNDWKIKYDKELKKISAKLEI